MTHSAPWSGRQRARGCSPYLELAKHKGSEHGLSSFITCLQTCSAKPLCQSVSQFSRSVVSDSLQPLGCSPPGSSVHGILQTRILECIAMPSSKGSSPPRDWTHISYSSCTAGRFFTTAPPGKPSYHSYLPQFSSVAQSCPTLCDPMNRSAPGLPVHHQLPEFTQTHVHQVGDAIQPSHPLSSPSLAPNPSRHQGLFQ